MQSGNWKSIKDAYTAAVYAHTAAVEAWMTAPSPELAARIQVTQAALVEAASPFFAEMDMLE